MTISDIFAQLDKAVMAMHSPDELAKAEQSELAMIFEDATLKYESGLLGLPVYAVIPRDKNDDGGMPDGYTLISHADDYYHVYPYGSRKRVSVCRAVADDLKIRLPYATPADLVDALADYGFGYDEMEWLFADTREPKDGDKVLVWVDYYYTPTAITLHSSGYVKRGQVMEAYKQPFDASEPHEFDTLASARAWVEENIDNRPLRMGEYQRADVRYIAAE